MAAPRQPGTKIVATVGPATSSPQAIERLLRGGVDVVRINFSHGEREEHARTAGIVRAASEALDRPVAILGDLCGPKIRLLDMESESVAIGRGERIHIVQDPVAGNRERLAVNHPEVLHDIQVGHRVLIDDGTIHLRVTHRDEYGLRCECEIGGTIKSRKGVNLPDTDLRFPALTEKDRDDLSWAVEAGLDYLGLSFVRRAEDMAELRRLLDAADTDIHIVAKIETPGAVRNIDAIIAASDGIMVARGDLGVEVDVAAVPRIQKDITHRCRRAGKPVIIATQMLQSMVTSPIPTRAEVSDVANAIYDGADAVMLSAETAVGQYPAEAVEVLRRVALETELYDQAHLPPMRIGQQEPGVTSALASSLCSIAEDVGAAAVVLWTRSGRLARLVSKHRLDRPVIAVPADAAVLRRLSLYYGVIPIPMEPVDVPDQRIRHADRVLREGGWAVAGDTVIIGFGPASLASGDTGSIVIHVVGGDVG